MAEGGVVECVVAVGYCIFIADAHSQPVAAVLLDLECHFARFVAFVLEGGFQQAEVVVVAFRGLDEVVLDYCYAIVLELLTELELCLGVEDAWILCCFLQDFAESLNLCSYFGLFCF